MRADIGIALDGDADRVIIVDERGHIVDGDQLLAVIARSWKDDGRLAKAGRRRDRDVQSRAGALSRTAWARARRARRSATATCSSTCAQRGYNVGGEQSGHIILSDYCHHRRRPRRGAAGAGGGARRRRKPVSEVCHRFEPLPQILKNVRYRSGKPLDNAERASRRSPPAKSSSTATAGCWSAPSGTEPVIRVMGEGDDRMLVEEVVDRIVSALGQAAAA